MIFYLSFGSVKIIRAELSLRRTETSKTENQEDTDRERERGMNSVRLRSRLSGRQKKGTTRIVFQTAETRQKSTFM
jgi:hypothetical protein